jgi:hypothetical protein
MQRLSSTLLLRALLQKITAKGNVEQTQLGSGKTKPHEHKVYQY